MSELTAHGSGATTQGAGLKRNLGGLQVFAISFAFISVAVGIFSTYDDLLETAGPVGIWLWVIAAVGQTLIALVVAKDYALSSQALMPLLRIEANKSTARTLTLVVLAV